MPRKEASRATAVPPPVKGRGVFSGTGIIVSGLAATVVALLVPLWSYEHRPEQAAGPLSSRTVATRYGPPPSPTTTCPSATGTDGRPGADTRAGVLAFPPR